MKVINLFGGPGSRKSTLAADLFARMKRAGFNVELVTEYAKTKVWEGHLNMLDDQLYILAKQNRRLAPLQGAVDYAITDSPLLLGLVYAKPTYFQSYRHLVWDLWNSYDNLNYFLLRPPKESYSEVGRLQTFEQAVQVDSDVKRMLDANSVRYSEHVATEDLADQLVMAISPEFKHRWLPSRKYPGYEQRINENGHLEVRPLGDCK